MKASKENCKKAKELLQDQSVFISEEAHDFILKFLNAVERKLPKEELMKHPK